MGPAGPGGLAAPAGVQLLRTLAGWFELANADELLRLMAGRPANPEFRLGALATAWPRLRQARSPAGLRAALAAAVRHAAMAEALRIIDAETRATQQRLRAVRDRWIPRLERALAEVTLAIEEQERADAARLRLGPGQSLSASLTPRRQAGPLRLRPPG